MEFVYQSKEILCLIGAGNHIELEIRFLLNITKNMIKVILLKELA